MNDNIRLGISRVARGESVNSVLHALLKETRMGDPDELERLYGADFNSRGHVNFTAHNDDELEVPAYFRQKLAHHGYAYDGSDNPHSSHVYVHPSGDQVVLHLPSTDSNMPMSWTHLSNFHPIADGHDGQSFLDHLDRHHGK